MVSVYQHGQNVGGLNANVSGHVLASEIAPGSYTILSIYITLIFCIGVTENAFVLIVYSTTRSLQTVNNIFIVGLALSDISQAILGIPLVTIASFARSWIFGDSGCIYYAFITTSLGISQITLLTAIAIERFQIIVHMSRTLSRTKLTTITAVGLCYGYGFLFALAPAVGWNSFQLEGANISCAINWKSKAPIDMSYSLVLMVFGWIIPLTVIVYSYVRIATLLRSEARKPLQRIMRQSRNSRSARREKRVALTVLYMIVAFVVSWMPYSIVSLWAMFGNPDHVTPTITMIPAVLAKSSIVWNPIIYVARHNDFRRACANTLPFLKAFKAFKDVHLTNSFLKSASNTGEDITSRKDRTRQVVVKLFKGRSKIEESFELSSKKPSGESQSVRETVRLVSMEESLSEKHGESEETNNSMKQRKGCLIYNRQWTESGRQSCERNITHAQLNLLKGDNVSSVDTGVTLDSGSNSEPEAFLRNEMNGNKNHDMGLSSISHFTRLSATDIISVLNECKETQC